MVAYHSVLVFNVLGWSGFERFDVPTVLTAEQRAEMPAPVVNLFETYRDVNDSNFMEYYHDAQLAKESVLSLFNLGYCTLEQRSMAEKLFFGICTKVLRIIKKLEYVPDEFRGLEAMLSDTYFCNMSIFQSIPDSWAIDQLFPIMPIHKLKEEPTCRGVLADITCDSDGKIDRFIDRRDVKSVLELHEYDGERLFHRRVSGRRVSGNPRRLAQSARRHQRRPRERGRKRPGLDRRSGGRRHRSRSAAIRAVLGG